MNGFAGDRPLRAPHAPAHARLHARRDRHARRWVSAWRRGRSRSIDTVLIKPLPFRIARSAGAGPRHGPARRPRHERDHVSRCRRSRARDAGASSRWRSSCRMQARPRRSIHRSGSLATTSRPSLFDTLGVQPMLGRAFTAEEGQPGHDNVVILGYGFWQPSRRAPDIIGQTLILDDVPSIDRRGHAARIFASKCSGETGAVYRPITPRISRRGLAPSAPFGRSRRLRDGASIEQAQSVAATVGDRLAARLSGHQSRPPLLRSRRCRTTSSATCARRCARRGPGRGGVADRRRQPDEPAARASDRARARSGGAFGARRRHVAAGARIAGRSRRAGSDRRHRRHCRRPRDPVGACRRMPGVRCRGSPRSASIGARWPRSASAAVAASVARWRRAVR